MSNFKKTGEEFLGYFIKLGKIKPCDRVLDVGCGIGRMAVPLARYLDKNGSYEGFDVVKGGIYWCKKKITPLYKNFSFSLADVFNGYYNPKGKIKACEYKFPYDNESFDFVFATSVFTHMLPQDTENYISEIARVLRKNGRCLITFFLLNQESLQLIGHKKDKVRFKCDFGNYRTWAIDMPETIVGYDEKSVLSFFKKHNLQITQPIRYGSWCGRNNFLSGQDIIVTSKI